MNIKQLRKIIKREVVNLKEQVGNPNIPGGNTGNQNLCDNDDFLQCSENHDLNGRFVNGQPMAFLERMWNKSYGAQTYTDDIACNFLNKTTNRHINQHSTGLGGPQSNRPMGPKWLEQKQSKIDFLNCVMPICGCDATP